MTHSSRHRRPHPNLLLRSLIFAVTAIGAVYLAISSVWPSRSNDFGYVIPAGLFDLAIAAWTFGVGASIGSFLNVVAWRLPRGKSINGRSHCPYCDNSILPRDNMPVIGWILLRGRCRFCHLPISSRYPIVEGVVGLSLMLLGLTVLYRGRAFLPYAIPNWGNNWPWRIAILDTTQYVAAGYLYAFGAILWAMALIRYDRHAVPKSLPVIGTIMTCAVLLIVPTLQPMPWQSSLPDSAVVQQVHPRLKTDQVFWEATDRVEPVLHMLLGASCGVAASLILGFMMRNAAQPTAAESENGSDRTLALDVGFGWSIAGLWLGWQTMLGTLPLIILVAMLVKRILERADRSACILIATAWTIPWVILLWPNLALWSYWPSPGHHVGIHITYGIASIGLFHAWSLQWPKVG